MADPILLSGRQLGKSLSQFRNEKNWIVTKTAAAGGTVSDTAFRPLLKRMELPRPETERQCADKSGVAAIVGNCAHLLQDLLHSLLIAGLRTGKPRRVDSGKTS